MSTLKILYNSRWHSFSARIWEHRPKTQKELARLAKLSEGAISGYCKRLRRAGLLEAEVLAFIMPGRDALVSAFPELEREMLRQGELLSSAIT